MGITSSVKTLVLPVAGLGKRLRPLTKRTPKALLSVAGRPLLDYALDEAFASGIRDAILIVSPRHLQRFRIYVERRRKAYKTLRLHIRLQREPLGTGHAILQAAPLTGGRPFAVRFCDDFILGNPAPLKRILTLFDATRAPTFVLKRVMKRNLSNYGVAAVRRPSKRSLARLSGLYEITGLVEKPRTPALAPSDLVFAVGCVLTPGVMNRLQDFAGSSGGHLQDCMPVTDAFRDELLSGHQFYGWEFKGKYFDCGNLAGFRKAEAHAKKHFRRG